MSFNIEVEEYFIAESNFGNLGAVKRIYKLPLYTRLNGGVIISKLRAREPFDWETISNHDDFLYYDIDVNEKMYYKFSQHIDGKDLTLEVFCFLKDGIQSKKEKL